MFKYLEEFFCIKGDQMTRREKRIREFPIERIAEHACSEATLWGYTHANEFFEEHNKAGDFQYRDQYEFDGEHAIETVRKIFEVGYVESILMTFGDEATMPCMGLVCGEIVKHAEKTIFDWGELHPRALRHIENNFYRIKDQQEDKFRLIAEWIVSEELERNGNAKPEIVEPLFSRMYGWRRKAIADMKFSLESWQLRYEKQQWTPRDWSKPSEE